MAEVPIDQAVVTWSGFTGAPGYSIWHALPGPLGVLARIREFYEALKVLLPEEVTINFPSEGRTIDASTGKQVGAWTGSAIPSVQGTGVGIYAPPVGACVNFHTRTLWQNHYIRGRTFLVPCVSALFFTNGEMDDSSHNILQVAANGLVNTTGENLVIWSRPYAGRPAGADGSPAKPAHDGFRGGVTSAVVPKLAAVLRSRRD